MIEQEYLIRESEYDALVKDRDDALAKINELETQLNEMRVNSAIIAGKHMKDLPEYLKLRTLATQLRDALESLVSSYGSTIYDDELLREADEILGDK